MVLVGASHLPILGPAPIGWPRASTSQDCRALFSRFGLHCTFLHTFCFCILTNIHFCFLLLRFSTKWVIFLFWNRVNYIARVEIRKFDLSVPSSSFWAAHTNQLKPTPLPSSVSYFISASSTTSHKFQLRFEVSVLVSDPTSRIWLRLRLFQSKLWRFWFRTY